MAAESARRDGGAVRQKDSSDRKTQQSPTLRDFVIRAGHEADRETPFQQVESRALKAQPHSPYVANFLKHTQKSAQANLVMTGIDPRRIVQGRPQPFQRNMHQPPPNSISQVSPPSFSLPERISPTVLKLSQAVTAMTAVAPGRTSPLRHSSGQHASLENFRTSPTETPSWPPRKRGELKPSARSVDPTTERSQAVSTPFTAERTKHLWSSLRLRHARTREPEPKAIPSLPPIGGARSVESGQLYGRAHMNHENQDTSGPVEGFAGERPGGQESHDCAQPAGPVVANEVLMEEERPIINLIQG